MKNATPPPPRCAKCGAELTSGSAGEWCPACILRKLAEEDRHDNAGSAATVLLPPTPPAGRSRPDGLEGLPPQYEIESLIGRGGMGAVYRGRHLGLNRPVAIKVLPADMLGDPEFAVRFRREARTLAKLHHPGIVSVHDSGETADGNLYFAMELVEGTDLAHLIRGKALPPAAALEIASQVCDALQYAHDQGVIHRDIKPANVLVTRDGRAKLADFGLARPDEDIHSRVTKTQRVMGTADYMAPEHRAGLPDHRADIFSLGVMLYEMLTGHTPRGNWPAPSKITSVDHRLDQIVLKALELEPDRRYQKASDLKSDLETLKAAAPLVARSQKRTRRWKIAAGVAAAGIAASAAGGGGWISKMLSRGDRQIYTIVHTEPTRVGPDNARQLGFFDPGSVVVASSLPRLAVRLRSGSPDALRITRLCSSVLQDSSSPPGSHASGPREFWTLRKGGLWTGVKAMPDLVAGMKSAGIPPIITPPSLPPKLVWAVVVPNKPLPDGAYCIHLDDLSSSCGVFVVNGLPELGTVNGRAVAKPDTGEISLEVVLRNTGGGEFNDGCLVVRAFFEQADSMITSPRLEWVHQLSPVAPGGEAKLELSHSTADWAPGPYVLHCYVGLRHFEGTGIEGRHLTQFMADTTVFSPPAAATPGDPAAQDFRKTKARDLEFDPLMDR